MTEAERIAKLVYKEVVEKCFHRAMINNQEKELEEAVLALINEPEPEWEEQVRPKRRSRREEQELSCLLEELDIKEADKESKKETINQNKNFQTASSS